MAAFLGGGGFMAGASQFAGDAFLMPSPQAGEAGGNDSGKGRAMSKTETVRNLTVRQLVRDCAGKEAPFFVDGHELQMLTLVGRITSSNESSSCIKYVLHDGTGSLECMTYINDAPAATLQKVQSDLRVGNYVRVFGILRPLQAGSAMCVQSYKTRPVTDFNEVTYHFLQVIFQRLHLNQGPPPAGAVAAAPQGAGHVQGMGAHVAGPHAAQGAQPGLQAQPLKQHVMELFNSADVLRHQNGINKSEALRLLQARGVMCTMPQLVDAIDNLTSEGQLYSTIDEDTHKTCQSM